MSPEQSAETVRVGRVGFTGTREGMTEAQRAKVNRLLRTLAPIWAHHGDCVGADDQFHELAKLAGAKIMLHPPEKPDLRAFRVGDDIAREKPYLARNRDIVNACETLIATPKEHGWSLTGGTWYTVNYACQQGRDVIVVWPNGNVTPAQSDGHE